MRLAEEGRVCACVRVRAWPGSSAGGWCWWVGRAGGELWRWAVLGDAQRHEIYFTLFNIPYASPGQPGAHRNSTGRSSIVELVAYGFK